MRFLLLLSVMPRVPAPLPTLVVHRHHASHHGCAVATSLLPQVQQRIEQAVAAAHVQVQRQLAEAQQQLREARAAKDKAEKEVCTCV